MLAIDLPEDVERRLGEAVRGSGRSVDEHVRDAILELLADLEDLKASEEVWAAIQRGEQKTIPLEEMMKRYGMED